MWIAAHNQVAFLNLAADALGDDCLGLTLATEFDCRDLGLWYYVLASSETLGVALERAARYSRIGNEALIFECSNGREPAQRLSYAGVPRHADRHQMEFCIVAAVRMYRLLTGKQFAPTRVSMVHLRENGAAAFARVLGTEVAFGSEVDEIVFPSGAADFPLIDADPHLNKILIQVGEEALKARKRAVGTNIGPVRVSVENAVTPLLPHGTARADTVAKKLGMSERTLARRLAEEGATFMRSCRSSRRPWHGTISRKGRCRSPRSLGSWASRSRAPSATLASVGPARRLASCGRPLSSFPLKSVLGLTACGPRETPNPGMSEGPLRQARQNAPHSCGKCRPAS